MGILKKSFCQSYVRERYDNLYACEWKVDGSGSKLSPDARIEVIGIEDLVDVEVDKTPNIPKLQRRTKHSYH